MKCGGVRLAASGSTPPSAPAIALSHELAIEGQYLVHPDALVIAIVNDDHVDPGLGAEDREMKVGHVL
ncbi:hypothetical protein BH10PSE13_BH10PSE13_22210 [soil metagenome]